MIQSILYSIIFLYLGQTDKIIDSDTIFFKPKNGLFTYFDHLERGSQNRNAIWVMYDRRPGIDPWFDGHSSNSEFDFIEYFKEREILIYGAFTTYDDCNCTKHRTMSSPDMYLLFFKIMKVDLDRLIKLHPNPESMNIEVIDESGKR